MVADEFARILSGLRIPQGYLDYALSKLRECHAAQTEFSAARRQKLQSQLNACHSRLDGLLQLKISPANAAGDLLSDEEYRTQKQRIQDEADMLQRQLAAAASQSETWIDDCEQFFAFTQGLTASFAHAAAEEKQSLLFMVCSRLTLRNHTATAEFREPFSSLAAFPLAGQADRPQFEPRRLRAAAEKPEIMDSWLGILDAIRTYGAPVVSFGATGRQA